MSKKAKNFRKATRAHQKTPGAHHRPRRAWATLRDVWPCGFRETLVRLGINKS